MGGGGVQRVVKFLKYFDYQAFRVSVVTVKASHSFAEDPTLEKDVPPGVQVLRSGSLDPFRLANLIKRVFPFLQPPRGRTELVYESSGFWRRIAMSLFLPDSRVLWLPFALGKLWRLHRRHPIDVLIASMPPFTTGLIGALFKRLVPLRLVLDFRDAWTENPYLPEIGTWHGRAMAALERFTLQHADGTLFVNPGLARYYHRRYPHLQQRPWRVIRNGYDAADLPRSLSRPAVGNRRRVFRMGILGTIYSQGNRPLTLLQALGEMLGQSPELRRNFRLVFIGKWSPDFLARFRACPLETVTEFVPYLPHRRALAAAAEMDALALAIESRFPGSERVTPGRIYEYLALRKPVLAMCPPNSDLAELIRETRSGEVVPYDDVEAIKRVLAQWLTYPDRSRENYAFLHLDQFERRVQTRELMAVLHALVPSDAADPEKSA